MLWFYHSIAIDYHRARGPRAQNAGSGQAMNALSSSTLASLVADLGDIPTVTDPKIVRRRSRDFFWYSPILNDQLDGKSADLIVAPRDEAEVVRVAAACARHRVPLTVRAGGTGNYGQAVPLEGGVLLDVMALAAVEWTKPGMMRVGVGAKMKAIDAELQPSGWEMRMHPSTKPPPTISRYVAGGSGGIGSVRYGGLRRAGHIPSAAQRTLGEEPPRIAQRSGA